MTSPETELPHEGRRLLIALDWGGYIGQTMTLKDGRQVTVEDFIVGSEHGELDYLTGLEAAKLDGDPNYTEDREFAQGWFDKYLPVV